MNDPKHTKAPWVAEVGECPPLGHEALAVISARHQPGEQEQAICIVSKASDADETDRANAQLIAAAPDMLAILTDIRDALAEDEEYGNRVCEWNFEGGTALEMVDWAIAKATEKGGAR